MKKVRNVKHRSCRPKKNIKVSAVALLLLIVLIAIAVLTGCSSKKTVLNLKDYVVVTVEGFSGYGSVDFDINYERLTDDTTASLALKQQAIEFAKAYDPFVAECHESGELHNGDTVTVSWNANEEASKKLANALDVKFIDDDFEYTISGLQAIKDYNPFEDLVLDTKKTISGNGEIDFAINCSTNSSNIVWDVSHDGKDGKIKNGDVLTLKIEDDVDMEEFTRRTGLKVTQTTCKYKVDCLGEYATDDTVFEHIGAKEEAAFDKVIEDWVVSSLNDEIVGVEKRRYELCGYIFYTDTKQKNSEMNDDVIQESNTEKQSNSMLIAIYKMWDPYVTNGYYVFIGLEDVFSYDIEGVYINHGDPIPSSFVHYKKEMVRYNEDTGWEQNSEAMGFMNDGLAYAGHEDVNETMEYLEKTYGKNYNQKFISAELQKIIG